MNFFSHLLDYFRKPKLIEPGHTFTGVGVQEVKPELPHANFVFTDGKLQIDSFNQAFVEELKLKLGDLTDGKTDREIVDLYLDRENIQREDPKLEVLHLGLAEDGTVKMKLDWNRSFITHLRENGIEGETEEEAVEKYLQLLHRKHGDSELDQEDADAVFADIDAELHREFEEARQQLTAKKKQHRRTRLIPDLPTSPESF